MRLRQASTSSWRSRRPCAILTAAVVLAAVLRLADVQAFQEPPPPSAPSFPSQASAITVDAVVLDKSGAPVRGLTRDDFTVLEDGVPQTIVGFDARTLESAWPSDPVDGARSPLVATNLEGAGQRGRTLVVLVDDLGLTPPSGQQVKAALAQWLGSEGVPPSRSQRDRAQGGTPEFTSGVPNDEVTILTTSGDIWWTDRLGTGRADLRAVLERVRGKRDSRSRSDLTMSDEEASLIEDASPLGATAGRGDAPATGPDTGTGPPILGTSGSVLDRVARRFLDSNLCSACRNCSDPMASCKSAAMSAAHLVNLTTRRRLDVLLGTLERLARSLAPMAGRKSILVLSEGFSRDENMEARYRAVVDAAQRGNTSVYFTAARGLTGPSGYSADSRAAAAPGDLGAMSVEENLLAFGGAAQVTDATGGVLTRSNDLAAGLERMATDLSAYYLLGYQPAPSAAGKWHKLEVRVNRPGVTVRARRGYRSGPPVMEPAPKAKDARRELQGLVAVSLAGGSRDAIPLRMALNLQGPDGAGGARIQIVVEADGSRLQVARTAQGAKASLELNILAVSRDRPTVLPLGETIDISLRPNEAADWWALFREVRLPPGVAQVRTTVRDPVSGALGTVTARIEVPDIEAPYLSTPFLTDRTQPPAAAGEPPRLVPTALRRFTRGRPLHCQYELFGFGGRDMPGIAQVLGGYTLRNADGVEIAVVPPTLISTDGRRVVRRITLPTAHLEPGAYELQVNVEDRLAGRAFTAREAFFLESERP
jgi:VWFA-related protein